MVLANISVSVLQYSNDASPVHNVVDKRVLIIVQSCDLRWQHNLPPQGAKYDCYSTLAL